MKYKIWDGKEDLITPVGEVFTADEVRARYPMAKKKDLKFIICDTAINMGVFMEVSSAKEAYRQMGAVFTENMTDQEIADTITAFEERPVVSIPTAEERIAAALEYGNLLKLEEKAERAAEKEVKK